MFFVPIQKRLEGLPAIRDVGCAHPGSASNLARIRCPKVVCQNCLSGCEHRCPKRPLRASVSEMTLACFRFQSQSKLMFGLEHLKLWVLLPLFNPCLWGGIQSTGNLLHATWILTVSAFRAILCCKNAVVKTKIRIQTLVFIDFKTDACKGQFWNGCTRGSFCALMLRTRMAILTVARDGLLGNGCAQDMEQIPGARNLHPGCTQPIWSSKKGSENCSSRFEPKITLILFSRGSGSPLNLWYKTKFTFYVWISLGAPLSPGRQTASPPEKLRKHTSGAQ